MATILFEKYLNHINPNIMRLLKTTNAVISGSTALYFAMIQRGLKPNFVPNDLDIYIISDTAYLIWSEYFNSSDEIPSISSDKIYENYSKNPNDSLILAELSANYNRYGNTYHIKNLKSIKILPNSMNSAFGMTNQNFIKEYKSVKIDTSNYDHMNSAFGMSNTAIIKEYKSVKISAVKPCGLMGVNELKSFNYKIDNNYIIGNNNYNNYNNYKNCNDDLVPIPPNDLKIDLIHIGPKFKTQEEYILSQFDLDICKSYFDGTKLHILYPSSIQKQKCELNIAPVLINNKNYIDVERLYQRLNKYRSRGFIINIDQKFKNHLDELYINECIKRLSI